MMKLVRKCLLHSELLLIVQVIEELVKTNLTISVGIHLAHIGGHLLDLCSSWAEPLLLKLQRVNLLKT